MIKYWIRIIIDQPPSLLKSYQQLLAADIKKQTWPKLIKEQLGKLGFANIFQRHHTESPNQFLNSFFQRLKDCHAQEYYNIAATTSRLNVLASLDINPNVISVHLKLNLNPQLFRKLSST